MKILSIITADSAAATPAKKNALRSDKLSDASTGAAHSRAPVPTAAPEERPAIIQPRPVINGAGIGLQFETDPATGTTVIRLVDLESGKLVRQIPAEEVLNYLQQLEAVNGRIFSQSF